MSHVANGRARVSGERVVPVVPVVIRVVVPVVASVVVEVREETVVQVTAATEAAAVELSASRNAPIDVAAAGEATDVAAPVTSPHGRPCRAASQREQKEYREEEDWQPSLSLSCGNRHDDTSEATVVPASQAERKRRTSRHIEIRASAVPPATPGHERRHVIS